MMSPCLEHPKRPLASTKCQEHVQLTPYCHITAASHKPCENMGRVINALTMAMTRAVGQRPEIIILYLSCPQGNWQNYSKTSFLVVQRASKHDFNLPAISSQVLSA